MVKYEDGKATQAMCKWIGNEYLVKSSSCIFVKKSPMRDFNKNRAYFFYFVTWISLSCLEIFMVFTNILTWKTWKPLVVFMELENKEIETWGIRLLDHRWYSWNAFLAPRGRSRCAAAAKKAFHEYHLWSRSRIPQVSIFWFSSFMNTTKGFQVFHVKITQF